MRKLPAFNVRVSVCDGYILKLSLTLLFFASSRSTIKRRLYDLHFSAEVVKITRKVRGHLVTLTEVACISLSGF